MIPPDRNRPPPPGGTPGAPRRAPTLSGMIAAWLLIGGLVYLAVLHLVPGLAPPRMASHGDSTLTLRADRAGNYEVDGLVNGVAVRFLVDTGATTLALSEAMARRMGIDGCMAGVGNTANGSVPVCMASARSVRFGPFEARDVRVTVLPNLRGRALLGMNVLSRLRITQSDGRMTLQLPPR